MRILVLGIEGTSFAFGRNERTGYAPAFFGLGVGLFEGADDERSDGGA